MSTALRLSYPVPLRPQAKRAEAQPAPSFAGYADFARAFNAARAAVAEVFGPRWHLHPQAYVWARLPAALASVLVEAPKGDQDGQRWSKAPRDQKLPIARFWPGGELPIGPEYAGSPTQLKPTKLQRVRDAEPVTKRRPSGISLPSGRERADADWYVEPRWLVEALLKVELFHGPVVDPFAGGGGIVGCCLQHGIPATGSDIADRGFGERRDAFTISEPIANMISNPPFAPIESVIRHFVPLVQRKLVLLARLNVLEGQARLALFRESPPARIWVSSRRASIGPGHLAHPRDEFGAMVPLPATGGSTAFCWICWDQDYAGPTILGWL